MADLEAITNPFVPTAFVRQVVAAVVPLIDKDELRDGKSRADVFEPLNPIVGHYTMADAFLAWRMLRTAQCASLYSEDSETSALYEAAYLLETFVARGWPSSADCVSARAAALKIDEEGEKAMGDDTMTTRPGQSSPATSASSAPAISTENDSRIDAGADCRYGSTGPWPREVPNERSRHQHH